MPAKMLKHLMIARFRLPFVVAALALAAVALTACQKVPLLAPAGSSITLTSSATALPTNGTTTIIAQVIEASGTPPHSGTLVTFTTSLGSIEPADARTDSSGRVTVTFHAGNQSGTATITAISGGANVGQNGAIKIAVGSAAVGRVNVSANPATVSSLGGSSTITANVLDINGNPLTSVPVTFSTTAGNISAAVVTTDQNGNASTVLTTAQQATVTGSVGAAGSTTPPSTGGGTGTGTGNGSGTGTGTGTGGSTSGQASGSVTVTVTSAPTLLITPPTTPPSVGLPAAFTFAVTAATANGSNVRDVTVNWGDGTVDDLGAVTGSAIVNHTYTTPGNKTIRATLVDAFGNTSVVSSTTFVVATATPTVIVTAAAPAPGHPVDVSFQIQVTAPTGVGITNAVIDWGDGGNNPVPGSPGPGDTQNLGGLSGTVTLTHTYKAAGTFTITLTVTDTLNRTTPGTTKVTIS